MILKSLSSTLAAVGAILLSATPSFSQSGAANRITYSCKSLDGIPTVVFRPSNAGSQYELPLLHFGAESLPASENPQQLCQQAAQNLQTYASDGFYGFSTDKVNGKPSVCIEKTAGDCTRVLFSLRPTGDRNPSLFQINQVYNSILDDSFKPKQPGDAIRTYESNRNEVNPINLVLRRFGFRL